MVQKTITNKLIKEMCKKLEFYDDNGYLPGKHRKVTLTLSEEAFRKLINKQNKSGFVNKLILT